MEESQVVDARWQPLERSLEVQDPRPLRLLGSASFAQDEGCIIVSDLHGINLELTRTFGGHPEQMIHKKSLTRFNAPALIHFGPQNIEVLKFHTP